MSLELQGSIVSGPSSDCSLPGATVNLTFEETPSAAMSAYGSKTVASPSSYVTLPGLGTGSLVTQGTVLYIRTRDNMKFRLTMYDSGGDVTSVVYLQGPALWRFPASNYLKLLEVQGSGTVEYFVAGPQ